MCLKDNNGQTRNLTGKHDMSYVVIVPYEDNNIILHGYFKTLARMDVTQAQKSINTMIYLLPFIQNHFLGVFTANARSNINGSERDTNGKSKMQPV